MGVLLWKPRRRKVFSIAAVYEVEARVLFQSAFAVLSSTPKGQFLDYLLRRNQTFHFCHLSPNDQSAIQTIEDKPFHS